MMMTCHYIVLLVFSCSSMVVLGVELSCNQSSTTCPGDVIQCQCQVISSLLQWLVRDFESVCSLFPDTTSSGPYRVVLCNVDESSSPSTTTSKLNVALSSTVDVTCRNAGGDINTTRLAVAGKLSLI